MSMPMSNSNNQHPRSTSPPGTDRFITPPSPVTNGTAVCTFVVILKAVLIFKGFIHNSANNCDD